MFTVCLTLLVILPTGCEAGDAGDDLSNNLFTDLAPLLALFGERVTMQFMSQSLGWLDNIILAMVPLGILTTIVSAIRVGGPSWLKSIIGRGRENLAVAEAELMSSTSKEVCELWNGREIVRCMGSAPITEFICLLKRNLQSNENPKFEMMDVKRAVQEGYLEDLDDKPWRVRHGLQLHSPTPEPNVRGDMDRQTISSNPSDDLEAEKGQAASGVSGPEIIIVRNTEADSPNLSLNCHDELHLAELYFFAMIGIVLQGLVIWYSCWATYRLKYSKDGAAVQGYALPCTVSGTGLLAIGMLLCSHVVESSTEEKTYQAGQGREARVIWLQKEKTVSDQDFAASAIFAEGERKFITTSRRGDKHGQAATLAAKTVSGTVISICGFVIQFVGLRGSHWSVSVVQLGAVLVMTGIRAWVRRGLAKPPRYQPLTPEFELEWLAITLGDIGNAPWRRYSTAMEGWCIDSPVTQEAQNKFHDEDQLPSNAHNIMTIRRDLGCLADWRGPASAEAIRVARAIEITMDALFRSYGESRSDNYTWSLVTRNKQSVHFRLKRHNGKWKAYSDEIDAALSLWLFSVHHDENGENYREKHSVGILSSRDDRWLRTKGQPAKGSLRLLGPYSLGLHRDLWWWMPMGSASVMRIEEVDAETVEEDKGKVIEMKSHRIVGHGSGPSSAHERLGKPIRYRATELTRPNFDSPGNHAGEPELVNVTLATESYAPLKSLYAQDMFSAFMWAAATARMDPIEDGTEIKPSDASDTDAWKSFTLQNFHLSKMARDIQSTGLGSLEEIYLSILPPLSAWQRLRPTDAIVGLASKHARRYEKVLDWEEAAKAYVWLFRTAKTFPRETGFATKATAVLLEYLRSITLAPKLEWHMGDLRISSKISGRSRGLVYSLEKELGIADREIVLSLMRLYEEQGRGWQCVRVLGDQSSGTGSEDYPEAFNFKKMHREASEGRLHLSRPSLRGKEAVLKDIHDWKPLHYAVANGKRTTVSVVLETKADVNAPDISGWTPLHYACQRGDDKVANSLIAAGAGLEVRDRDGVAPLHRAAMGNHINVARVLIESGAAIDILDNPRNTPLDWAIYGGHEDMAQYLWQAANKKLRDRNGRTALHFAAMVGGLNLAKLPNFKDGIDIDAKDNNGWTPLHFAAAHQHESFVEQLIDMGANQDVRDRQRYRPLDLAIETQDESVVRVLVEKGGRSCINAKNYLIGSPLFQAAQRGHEAVARLLLDLGADIEGRDGPDGRGMTALHIAAARGRESVVSLLAERGADLEASDHNFGKPLQTAARSGHVPVVRLLVKLGADIEARDRHKRTALHLGAINEQEQVVRLLIELGANIAVRDSNDKTPLDWAVAKGNDRIASLLIDAGANAAAEGSS